MTKLLVAFAAVLGPLAQTLSAADNRMPIKPVELFLSENAAQREQGDRQIVEERAKLISRLGAFISDPDNHVRRRRASVERAMLMLGHLHATQGIKPLVAYISFPYLQRPVTEPAIVMIVTGGTLLRPAVEMQPAISALVCIGQPCVNEVIKKLGTTGDGLEADACMEVLKRLSERPSVRAKLQSALQRSAPRNRTYLQKALKMLGDQPNPSQGIGPGPKNPQ